MFKQTGKYIGLGFPVNNYGTEYLFFRTNWKPYFLDDIGMFEPIVRFGLFSIPIYVYPFYLSIKIMLSVTNEKNSYAKVSVYSLIVPLTMYMILSNVVQNIYVIQNSISVPFYIAVISIMNTRYKK